MSIYTRTGDKGKTALVGDRRNKDDLRVEAYGTVDEANSFVGDALSALEESAFDFSDMIEVLDAVQQELFDTGSDLATVGEVRPYKVSPEMVDRLEPLIDLYMSQAVPVKKFIIPGGSRISSKLHLCRTVTRRAERRVVALAHAEPINPECLRYLNRLSDLFFAMARAANARCNRPDREYVRSRNVFRHAMGKNEEAES
ncbi:cob(I)yrinic acid a,c-diamide adenosyltransferase [Effusibacillus dendaii]|uniref:Corrinoid adenosyltransferase n=1 Tax=Effusibacillus dendaii TaxID=2743772 RepID=A0A7I8DB90_9BACL|nr:cob(I)yrinic acid a,c-diamide adenosyltransferase [Effusibacillus dendaii]BCJ86106.1 Cob(I)yrinic acid a,c-diamide adenosyltransferase [Effusibacillus dendaii]